MEPKTTQNLDLFLNAYRQAGRYGIAPAYYAGSDKQPEALTKYAIGKTELSVRPTWQVDEYDEDVMGLRPDDDPIIPPEISDPV